MVEVVTTHEHRRPVTLLLTTCADGTAYVPPLVIHSGSTITGLNQANLPPGWISTVTPTSYTNDIIFLSWANSFIKHSRLNTLATEPLYLVLDPHFSHINAKALELLLANNVYCIFIPAHTSDQVFVAAPSHAYSHTHTYSHLHTHTLPHSLSHAHTQLQPNDRALNNLFKNAMSMERARWRDSFPDQAITEADINSIIRKSWLSIVQDHDTIRAGWKRSHFYPFDMGEHQLSGASLALLHKADAAVDLSAEPTLKHCHKDVIDCFLHSRVDPQKQFLQQQEVATQRKQHIPLNLSKGCLCQSEQVTSLLKAMEERVCLRVTIAKRLYLFSPHLLHLHSLADQEARGKGAQGSRTQAEEVHAK